MLGTECFLRPPSGTTPCISHQPGDRCKPIRSLPPLDNSTQVRRLPRLSPSAFPVPLLPFPRVVHPLTVLYGPRIAASIALRSLQAAGQPCFTPLMQPNSRHNVETPPRPRAIKR